MGFSYDKLWKKLIDEKMNKLDLQNAIKTTPYTIDKMGRDENVSMEILGRICSYFKCDISDVLDYRNKWEFTLEFNIIFIIMEFN